VPRGSDSVPKSGGLNPENSFNEQPGESNLDQALDKGRRRFVGVERGGMA
jgi:hypothetical protein